MRAHRFALLLGSCLLAACGTDKPGANGAQGDDGLPKPAAAGRSVTGMPEPGAASSRPASMQAPESMVTPTATDAGIASATPDETATDGNPDSAVSLLRDYYAAINARDYGGAYRAWGDGGRASGQTPEQFAAGFAGTAGVSVQVGAPGRIEGAAGSRYVQVPLTLDARQADGSVRRYQGSYTLRMSVVEGATPDQQGWRIASADLRELRE